MCKYDKILQASLRLFIKDGFHATPTSKIAKEAGVSNGTLFHYFKTKEILVSELYLSIKRQLRDHLINNLDRCKTTREKVKYIWISWVKWGIENSEKIVFFKQFHNSPYISCESRKEGATTFSFIFDIIDEGIDNGSLINIDRHLLSSFMFASTYTMIAFAHEFPKKIDENNLETGFKMLWRGIANI